MKSSFPPSILVFVLALPVVLAACGDAAPDRAKHPVVPPTASSSAPGQTLARTIEHATESGSSASAELTGLSGPATCGLADFERELMNRINEARKAPRMCGSELHRAAAPLRWNTKLSDAAAMHSIDMSLNDYFSHTSRDGRTIGERISAVGYPWTSYAENIAAGQVTIAEVMRDWLGSPGHCANVMKVHVTEVGVACANNTASTYKMYWSMEFADSAR